MNRKVIAALTAAIFAVAAGTTGALADKKSGTKTIFNPPPPVPLEAQKKHGRPGNAASPRKQIVTPDGTIIDIILIRKHKSDSPDRKKRKRAYPVIME